MYSVEDEVIARARLICVRFWKEDVLVRVQLYRCLLSSGIAGSYVAGASHLLSVISAKPNLVSVSECSASVVQSFVRCKQFRHGVHFLFRFDAYSLPTLMQQGVENVFGSIDFFSQLRYLVVALSGILIAPWSLQWPKLTEVSSHPTNSSSWSSVQVTLVNFVLGC